MWKEFGVLNSFTWETSQYGYVAGDKVVQFSDEDYTRIADKFLESFYEYEKLWDKTQDRRVKRHRATKTEPKLKVPSIALRKPLVKLPCPVSDQPAIPCKNCVKTPTRLVAIKEAKKGWFESSKKTFASFDATAKKTVEKEANRTVRTAGQRFTKEICVEYVRKVRRLWSSYRGDDSFVPGRLHRTAARKSSSRIPLSSLRTHCEHRETCNEQESAIVNSNLISMIPQLKAALERSKDTGSEERASVLLPGSFKGCLASSPEKHEARVVNRPYTSSSRKAPKCKNPLANTLIRQFINPVLSFK